MDGNFIPVQFEYDNGKCALLGRKKLCFRRCGWAKIYSPGRAHLHFFSSKAILRDRNIKHECT